MKDSQKKKLTGAAIIVMTSIIVSRITGFLRTTLVTNMLRSQVETDSFFMAFKITDLMYNLLVGGAISAALIPVLSGYIVKKDEEEGWKAVGTFINVIFILMTFISTMGIIFSPQIVRIIARDFDAERMALTARLARILFPSVSFIMLAGLTNGVLNSYQKFAAAAYGPSLYNLGSAASLLLFSRYGVEKVAIGFMCSALFYFLFQLSFAIKNMRYYTFRIYLRHPGFSRLFRLAIPSLIASSITQVNLVISARFTSGFESGSVTALTNASDTWQLPYGVFAMGMGVAILPALSERFALGELEDYKSILHKSLKTVLLLNIPSAFGLLVLNIPVISAIFKWSDKADIPTTGRVLVFYSIALVTQSILALITRAFYAINDTRTPLYVGTVTIVINAALCQLFNSFTSLEVAGIALAYSIASLFNACILLVLLNYKIKGIYLDKLLFFIMKVSFASAVMSIVLLLINKLSTIDYVRAFSVSSKISELSYLVLEISAGAIIFFLTASLMKINEAIEICNTIMWRVRSLILKVVARG